jgi:hypothetical protein
MTARVFLGLGELEGLQDFVAAATASGRLFNPGANFSNSFRPK